MGTGFPVADFGWRITVKTKPTRQCFSRSRHRTVSLYGPPRQILYIRKRATGGTGGGVPREPYTHARASRPRDPPPARCKLTPFGVPYSPASAILALFLATD